MITRLRVQGYKSFADAELRLGPLNVIVGPNNVGKSNLFDLLKLLSRFAQVPFRQAFDEREHRGDPVESFRDGGRAVLTVELGFDLRGAPHPFDGSKGPRWLRKTNESGAGTRWSVQWPTTAGIGSG